MSILASELIARITVQGAKEAQAQLTGVGNASDRAGGLLKGALVLGALGAGAAIVGLGIKATKMAADYQTSMTQLVTGAGESEKNLGMVSKGILDMALQTGTATDQLSQGMYMIESAGFHGARGLDILKAAAEGAKVGNAQLADVANGVTTIMTDYAKTGITATQATNILIAAVASGKTHMQDMSTAMATILPTSSAVGVSMRDTAAAMATMTGEGTNAASAATYLKQLLIALEAPSSGAAKALKDVGLSTAQVADAMHKSLPDALKLITDRLAQVYGKDTPAYVDALKQIAGGSRQMQGILELTGSHLKTFSDNVNNITDAVNKGGKAITGWNLVQQDFNFKLDQAKAGLEVLGITLGTKLLPILTPLISRFSDWALSMGTLANKTDFSGLASALKDIADTAGGLFDALGNILNVMRPLAPAIVPVTKELLALWAAFKLLSIGGAVSSSITAMTTFGTAASTATTNIGPLSIALRGLAVDIGTIGVGATAAIGGLTLLDAALLTNMYTTQQADDAAIGSKQKGSAALQAYTNQEIADLEKLHSQGLIKSQDDWNAWKQSIAATLQKLSGVSYDEAQQMAQNVINAAKSMQKTTTSDLEIMKSQWQRWLDYIAQGGTQSFDTFRAADNRATENFLRNQARMHPSIEQTRKKLEELSKGSEMNQAASNKSTAAFLADQARMQNVTDQTRKHLELLNGPFTPKVNLGNIYMAMTEANAAYWAFQRLNGTSRWTAYIQQVSIGAASPPGGPRAHAAGVMNNPVGHWAMVGEQGPELMYVPQGASIYPHGQSAGMTQGNQPINVNVYLDGAPVAKKLMPHIVQNIRTSTGVRI